MKKYFFPLLLILCCAMNLKAQKISTFQFTEIINDNRDEAIYYFQNNWKQLRDLAIKEGFINSYQLHETEYSEEAPFHLILITTYSNQEQFDNREANFEKIMEDRKLKLLNDKNPGEFRKTVFVKEQVRQLE